MFLSMYATLCARDVSINEFTVANHIWIQVLQMLKPSSPPAMAVPVKKARKGAAKVKSSDKLKAHSAKKKKASPIMPKKVAKLRKNRIGKCNTSRV